MDRAPVTEKAKTKTEELEDKLEARRVERAKAETAQYETDLEARMALEDTHGSIAAVKLPRYVPGQPTRALVKTPDRAQYKRYKDQVQRASERKNLTATQDACDLLARVCWVYPAEDKQDAMLDVAPGLLTQIFIAAVALAEGKADEEGKG